MWISDSFICMGDLVVLLEEEKHITYVKLSGNSMMRYLKVIYFYSEVVPQFFNVTICFFLNADLQVTRFVIPKYP